MTVPTNQGSSGHAAWRVGSTFRVRMLLFLASLAMVLLGLGLTGYHVTRSATALAQGRALARGQAYRVAYELKTGVIRLALLLGQYQQTGDGPVREAFLAESRELLRWLESQRTAITPAARAMLDDLAAGLDRAVKEVQALVLTGDLSALTADLQARLFGAGDASSRVAISDAAFARTQRLSAERDLDALQSSLDWLRTWSVASTLLIAVLVAWLGHFLWRQLVAPLRTRVIESESLIRRQAKLSTLGRFAAGIAHEIRNPLNSIKARLFAQDRALPPDSPAHEDNQVINDEVVRLEQIVKDFLAFSRPPEPRLETVSAQAVLKTAAEVLRPELERERVQLQISGGEDPSIRADAAQLQQVLVNLIRNAQQSMTAGGRITLRCGTRVARRGETRPRRVVLEVRDTGSGIPPEIQARLFEPFFTTKASGSGLGLSISAHIIEAHGGRIECETQLNVGTVFRILLPDTTEHAKSPESSSGA